MEVKGTGTANQCPTIDGGSETFSFKPGKYAGKKFCFEPTSFTVKAESVSKNAPPDFQNTKLMTRLTYTLDEIEGPFEVFLFLFFLFASTARNCLFYWLRIGFVILFIIGSRAGFF